MVRKLIPALVLLAAHFPGNALALGVGDIKLESALNQEFNAYIDLLSVKSDELDGVKVQLAAPDAFERAGIDRPYLLSKLRFNTQLGPDGSPVIRVTSREAIREPFLNFLIEVNWAKGRLVREFTVLLDPPVLLERKAAPVVQPEAAAEAAPATAAVEPARRETPSAEAPRAVASEPDTAAGTEYGPVQSADTLWAIAKSVKPSGASIEQTMMALQRENPHAFIRNNVNNLKKGVILRIPDQEEIESQSHREARAEFLAQVDDWRAGRGSAKPVVEESHQEPAEAEMAQPEPEPKPEAQLEIASARPDEEGRAGASEGEGRGTAKVDELEQSLILANEQIESARQENTELNERLHELEEKLAKLEEMQRLVSVRDEQAALVQAAVMEEAVEPAEEPMAEPEMAEEEPVAEEPVVEEPAAEPEPEPASEPEPAPQPAPMLEEPARKPASTMDHVMNLVEKNQTAVLAGGGILVALLGALFFMRRRKAGEEEIEEEGVFAEGDEATVPAPPVAAPEPKEEEAIPEQVGGETSFLSDFAASEIDNLQDDTGEVDPVSEADVYIAYGRFEQAEELVSQALSREPDRIDLKAKLLEIHANAETTDAETFVALAEEVSAGGGKEKMEAEAWSKVVALGQKLAPAHALFAGAAVAAAATAEASVDAELDALSSELDLDLDLEEAPQSEEASTTEALADEDSSLDLDLDFDDALEDIEPADEGPSLDQELSLDQTDSGLNDIAAPLQGLDELSVDELMPDQPGEEAEPEVGEIDLSEGQAEMGELDDLSQDLADLSEGLDLDLDLGEEEPGTETETADLAEGLDLDLDLGEQGPDVEAEAADLGEGLDLDLDVGDLPSEDAALDLGEDLDLGIGDLDQGGGSGLDISDSSPGSLDISEEPVESAADLEQELADISEGLDLGESAGDELPDAAEGLDLGADDGLDQVLSGLSEELDMETDAAEDLERTLSGLSDGLDLMGEETEDLEESLSSLSDELDLGDAANLESLDETLSGFAEGLVEEEDEGEDLESLLGDVSLEGLGEDSETHEGLGLGDSTQLDPMDEAATKLDLARAYIDMGDEDGARNILDEVTEEGNEEQQQEAQKMLDQLA